MKNDPLKNILSRLQRLERVVFSEGPSPSPRITPSLKGLPGLILKLRAQGFFTEPRTALEVHEKLRSTYHCQRDRVAMALLRLQRRKQLRKASKVIGEKRQVAYVW